MIESHSWKLGTFETGQYLCVERSLLKNKAYTSLANSLGLLRRTYISVEQIPSLSASQTLFRLGRSFPYKISPFLNLVFVLFMVVISAVVSPISLPVFDSMFSRPMNSVLPVSLPGINVVVHFFKLSLPT